MIFSESGNVPSVPNSLSPVPRRKVKTRTLKTAGLRHARSLDATRQIGCEVGLDDTKELFASSSGGLKPSDEWGPSIL
jgi:hypothetical protein